MPTTAAAERRSKVLAILQQLLPSGTAIIAEATGIPVERIPTITRQGRLTVEQFETIYTWLFDESVAAEADLKAKLHGF